MFATTRGLSRVAFLAMLGVLPSWCRAVSNVNLNVTPAANIRSGQVIGLSATVSANGLSVHPGTITFRDGLNLLGSAQLTAAGTASIKTRLGNGTHKISATFAATTAVATGSATVYVAVGAGILTATQTSLVANTQDAVNSLTATVTATGLPPLTGNVTFKDISTNTVIGSPVLSVQSTPSTAVTPINVVALGFIGDFNDDGILDIAGQGFDIDEVTYLGQADGNFNLSSTNPDYDSIIGGGDFNNDGHVDLLRMDSQSRVEVLLGDGSGSFQHTGVLLSGFTGVPFNLKTVVSDLNGDGNLDILVFDPGTVPQVLRAAFGKGDGTFTAPVILSGFSRLGAFTVADFNSDGVPDIAAIGGTGNLIIGLNTGTGSFTTSTIEGAGAELVVAADFNNDGNVDLVGSSSGTLNFRAGNGDGTFKPPVTSASQIGTQVLSVADYNNDGQLDLVGSSCCTEVGEYPYQFPDSTVGVALGSGDGTFHDGLLLQVGATTLVTAFDANGDGFPDILEGDSQGVPGVILQSTDYTGTASLTGTQVPNFGVHQFTATYSGNAGYQTSTSTPTLVQNRVYAGARAYVLAYGQAVTLVATIKNYAVASYTTDGEEIAFYNDNQLLGMGKLFHGVATLTVTLPGGQTFITAKFAGDTHFASEVSNVTKVTVQRLQTTLSLVLSSTEAKAGTPIDLVASVLSGARTVTGGTVNFMEGNRVLGTAQITAAGQAQIKARFGVGVHKITATFQSTSKYSGSSNTAEFIGTGSEPSSLQLSISGSTLMALVQSGGVYAPAGYVTFRDQTAGKDLGSVYLDQTASQQLPAQLVQFATPWAGSVAAADINGDGVVDLVQVAGFFDPGFNTLVEIGKGNGTFTEHKVQVNGSGDAEVILLADFNNDGKPDLLSRGSVSLGKGDGTFAPAVSLNTSQVAIAVGDVNGDGNLDIVLSSLDVLFGNGDGTFRPGLPPSYTASDIGQGVLADLNGDGTLDLVAYQGVDPDNQSPLLVFLGNNDGSFRFSASYSASGSSLPLQIEDVNGDGTPDILEIDVGSKKALLGKGNGTFQPEVTLTSSTGNQILLLGADLNGDSVEDYLTEPNGGEPDGSWFLFAWSTWVPFPLPAGISKHTVIASYSGDSHHGGVPAGLYFVTAP